MGQPFLAAERAPARRVFAFTLRLIKGDQP